MRNASESANAMPRHFSAAGPGWRTSTHLAPARTWAAHWSLQWGGNVGAGDIIKANESGIRSLNRSLTMLIWLIAAMVV